MDLNLAKLNVSFTWTRLTHMQDLEAITDEHVEHTLSSHDTAQGKYLDDDPELETILQHVHLR